LKIAIQTIPHGQQYYDTVGDWFDGPDGWQMIRVSELGNPDMEFLIALHEFLENYLARKREITPKMVDEFDINFKGEGEPGDDPKCPYFPDHQAATKFEREMADYLGVDWDEYEKAINGLSRKEPRK
jgi:Ni,Fe-hydrogenase III component G